MDSGVKTNDQEPMHNETSNTWLNSLRNADRNADGWQRLVNSYGPFVRNVLSTKGIHGEAADDIVQNVMTVVVRRVSEFRRQRTGSFRSWLRTITVNCLRDHLKTRRNKNESGSEDVQDLIQAMDDPKSGFTQLWNRQHACHVVDILLDRIGSEFSPKTIEAFKRLALQDETVDSVAEDLEMTTNACFIARSRVVKRLKTVTQEMFGTDEGLLDTMR